MLHRGVDLAGRDGVDQDSVRTERAGQAPGHGDDPGLADHVGVASQERPGQPGHRSKVDDAPAAAGRHHRVSRLAAGSRPGRHHSRLTAQQKAAFTFTSICRFQSSSSTSSRLRRRSTAATLAGAHRSPSCSTREVTSCGMADVSERSKPPAGDRPQGVPTGWTADPARRGRWPPPGRHPGPGPGHGDGDGAPDPAGGAGDDHAAALQPGAQVPGPAREVRAVRGRRAGGHGRSWMVPEARPGISSRRAGLVTIRVSTSPSPQPAFRSSGTT